MIEKIKTLERALLLANPDKTNENVITREFRMRGINDNILTKYRNHKYVDSEVKKMIDNINIIAGYYEHKEYDELTFNRIYKSSIARMKKDRLDITCSAYDSKNELADNFPFYKPRIRAQEPVTRTRYGLENNLSQETQKTSKTSKPAYARPVEKKKSLFSRFKNYVTEKVEDMFQPIFAYR